MLLYINKNCSGYHWFKNLLPDTYDCADNSPYIEIKRVTEESATVIPLVDKLRMSAQYDYCFARQGDKYILALNGIPELNRKDDIGRPIHVNLIFIADSSQKVLLFNMLLHRVKDLDSFARQIESCFQHSLNKGCILCSWKNLSEYFKSLYNRNAQLFPETDDNLLAAKGDQSALRGFGFRDSEMIARAEKRLLNLIKEIDKDEELTTDPDSHATKTTDPEPVKNDDDLTPDELRAKLSKLKADKQALDTNVETLSSTVRGLKEKLSKSDLTIKDLAKKIRLRNGIIASLVAIIIILIIITLF